MLTSTNIYALNLCDIYYFKFYATGWGKQNYLWSFKFKNPSELFNFIDAYHCKNLVIHAGWVHGISGHWLHIVFQLKHNRGNFDLIYKGEEHSELGFNLPNVGYLPVKR